LAFSSLEGVKRMMNFRAQRNIGKARFSTDRSIAWIDKIQNRGECYLVGRVVSTLPDVSIQASSYFLEYSLFVLLLFVWFYSSFFAKNDIWAGFHSNSSLSLKLPFEIAIFRMYSSSFCRETIMNLLLSVISRKKPAVLLLSRVRDL